MLWSCARDVGLTTRETKALLLVEAAFMPAQGMQAAFAGISPYLRVFEERAFTQGTSSAKASAAALAETLKWSTN
jgi:hypothetical protein